MTEIITPVAGVVVAVIALLVGRVIDDSIPTKLVQADCIAAITVRRIPVVAYLLGLTQDRVSTTGHLAVAVASIAVDRVAVITFLEFLKSVVPTEG